MNGVALPSRQRCVEAWRSADAVYFDVDSTVITEEGLDELADFCDVADKVKKITTEAMRGGLDFRDALRARLSIIRPSVDAVQKFIQCRPAQLTRDIDVLVNKLHSKNVDVYLVSGGFRCLIEPVAEQLNIPLDRLYANRLKFYYDGEYAGFDEGQPTSRTGGKAEVVRFLRRHHGYSNIVMVGDGATDMEACPPADAFIGFGGNVIRENVKNKATWYVYDFATLVDHLKTKY